MECERLSVAPHQVPLMLVNMAIIKNHQRAVKPVIRKQVQLPKQVE